MVFVDFNMRKSKLVTVLMCVYNTPLEQLKLSIESILKQTYRDFDFLIIDDFSQADISKMINNYHDDRIIYLKNEKNLGLALSLNKGIKLINTKYIARMDSDDIAYPDRLEKQIKFALEHDEYAIVSGCANQFNEDGIYGRIGKFGEKNKKDLIKSTPFIHPTMLIKTDELKKIGGYPNYRRGQDYAMEMDMYSQGLKGYVMDDILIKYRMDSDGYKKKKFKYRIMEFKIRCIYYKKMGVKIIDYIYVFKPLIVGLVPKKFLEIYHHYKFKIR